MDSRKDKRYLHIAGAFGAGGRFTKAGKPPIDLPIETVAPVHLPMVGGRSESSGSLKLDGQLSVGAAHSLAESDPAGPNGPFVSRTASEVKNIEVPVGFFV